MTEQEQEDLDQFYELAARLMGGKLLRVEEVGVIIYQCGKCSKEHCAEVALSVIPRKPPEKQQDLTAFLPALECESVKAFLEE